MREIKVRVPATTANLGPGFDCLGVAVKLYNYVTVKPSSSPNRRAFFREILDYFFAAAQVERVHLDIEIEGDVPRSRGLGSSVTVRLGLLCAVNELSGRPLTQKQLLDLTIELEGHPDNAVPAFYGGFCACGEDRHLRVAVPAQLKFVAVIPGFQINTEEARGVLPKKVALKDAVINLQNSSLITGAFCGGDFQKLTGCFRDRLHQPYRAGLLPGFQEAVDAAEASGALGAYLSGSGSTLMALTLKNAPLVAQSMVQALKTAGHRQVTSHVLTADNKGVRVL